MIRVLLITVVIVTAQWVLMQRYPEPKWVLLTLAVPALVCAVALGRSRRPRLSVLTTRRGGHR